MKNSFIKKSSTLEEEEQRMKDVVSRIQATMVNELGMICRHTKSSSYYVSANFDSASRLLVIIPYREAGLWSRSICLNGNEAAGTMIEYLQKALVENYGIVVMNPAAAAASGSEFPSSPKAHVEAVWNDAVVRQDNQPNIYIIAYSKGCQLAKHLLNVDSGSGIMQRSVRALALVEPSHVIDPKTDSYFARRLLSRRAVAWLVSESSVHPVGSFIQSGEKTYGCVCISAGAHNESSGTSSTAHTLQRSIYSVFGSFAARTGKKASVTSYGKKKPSFCSLCRKNFGMLHRKWSCAWCELRVCTSCICDKKAASSSSSSVIHPSLMCKLCQSLPVLIDPITKEEKRDSLTSSTTKDFDYVRDRSSSGVCIQDFELIKLIGRGACGRVKLVRKTTGADIGSLYALKSIKKNLVTAKGLVEATNAERRIMKDVKHPFIAKLRYAFQTPSKLHLLTEYYDGGNLLDQMRKVRRFPEDRSRLYAAEVVLALGCLHSHNIMYRDLKLENVLVDSSGHIALTDFGMSKENVQGLDGVASTFVGTYQMMAPELIGGKAYTKAVDWWALGVMVYEMIEGKTPFHGRDNATVKNNINNASVFYSSRFSKAAAAFVSDCLTRDVSKRLGSTEGLSEVKKHEWFKNVDWDLVEKREGSFAHQAALMATHAKAYQTEDIFTTYMHAREKTVDTPASCQQEEGLFQEFSFNFMNDTALASSHSDKNTSSSLVDSFMDKLRPTLVSR